MEVVFNIEVKGQQEEQKLINGMKICISLAF